MEEIKLEANKKKVFSTSTGSNSNLIHFSDGIFSEEQIKALKHSIVGQNIDEKPQTWISYIISILDGLGESLAYGLGITSPKYQYAIDEYLKRKEEEQEIKKFEKREKEARNERIVFRKKMKEIRENDEKLNKVIMKQDSDMVSLGDIMIQKSSI